MEHHARIRELLQQELYGLPLSSYFLIGFLLIGSILILLNNMSRKSKMNIPYVKGGYPFFGQVFEMIKGSPWDVMTKWSLEFDGIYRLHLFGSDAICVSDPELIKVIFSLKLRTFHKDLHWTYKPFLVSLAVENCADNLIGPHVTDATMRACRIS
jgi:hypothetical protein